MEAIRKEIEKLENRITWEKEMLDKAVEDFREHASWCDAYSIETFIPGKVREIAEYRAKLEKYDEQKKMLEYLLRQQEV